MKKSLLSCLIACILCLSSCTNVIIWTPSQVFGLFCLGILAVFITFMYVKYKLEKWWKNRK